MPKILQISPDTQIAIESLMQKAIDNYSSVVANANRVSRSDVRDKNGLQQVSSYAEGLSQDSDATLDVLKTIEVGIYRDNGFSYDEIAAILGIWRDKVRNIITENFPHLAINSSIISNRQRRENAVEMHNNGIGIEEIARILHMRKETMVKLFRERNLDDIYTIRNSKRNQEILKLRESGMTYSQIAKRVGLTKETVSIIVRKKRPDIAGDRRLAKYEDKELRNNVIRLREEGKTYQEIYDETGVNFRRAKEILEGR